MSKTKPRVDAFPAGRRGDSKSSPPTIVRVSSSARTIRETVESIVIAFVLAFLFRTFEAEAFVIPTGSMAPTLQGRHKDIVCPKCSRQYQASASIEAADRPEDRRTVSRTICPQCGFNLDVDPRTSGQHPSYPGDRILVGKFSYEFNEPERWDVIVFKYPEDAKVNYIKRLVALPGETVRITGGNIYTKGPNQPEELRDQFVIQRKSDDKLRAMLQMVYDNQFQPEDLIAKGWPRNWGPAAGTSPDAWTASDSNRTFATDRKTGEEAWLRYQHVIPTKEDWDSLKSGVVHTSPEPSLITDHYAYNDSDQSRDDPGERVSDLAVELNLNVQDARGEVVLQITRAGQPFQCLINLESGEAKMSSPAFPELNATAKTSLNQVDTHEVLFANVDDQLRLFVDGEAVAFEGSTTYTPTPAMHGGGGPLNRGPLAPPDDAPVSIGAIGSAIDVSGLKVLRDIHYRAISSRFHHEQEAVEFTLEKFPEHPGLDQFFVLGDNSPQSKDSRLWEEGQHYVDRNLLIGKALYIYWPHSFDAVYIGDTRIPFPFFPNFSRMGFVR